MYVKVDLRAFEKRKQFMLIFCIFWNMQVIYSSWNFVLVVFRVRDPPSKVLRSRPGYSITVIYIFPFAVVKLKGLKCHSSIPVDSSPVQCLQTP